MRRHLVVWNTAADTAPKVPYGRVTIGAAGEAIVDGFAKQEVAQWRARGVPGDPPATAPRVPLAEGVRAMEAIFALYARNSIIRPEWVEG